MKKCEAEIMSGRKDIILTIDLRQKFPSPRDFTTSMLNSYPKHHFPTSPTELGTGNWELGTGNLNSQISDIFHRDPSRGPTNLPKVENNHKFARKALIASLYSACLMIDDKRIFLIAAWKAMKPNFPEIALFRLN